MQLIPLTEFTRKLPLFKMRCAGAPCGAFSRWWTTGNGCFEKCLSWNDGSHCVCPLSAMVRRQEQMQGGLLSTGLIDGLNLQEDLKATSALTAKSFPGSHLHHHLGAQLHLPVGAAQEGAAAGQPWTEVLTQVPRPGVCRTWDFVLKSPGCTGLV